MALLRNRIPRRRSSRIVLRVWRFVSGDPQWLYTYAGPVDHVVLENTMQTVRRLTESIPGEWVVDVLVVGIPHHLLRAMEDDLRVLRGRGVQPCVRRARAVPRWLRRHDVAADPPPLLH